MTYSADSDTRDTPAAAQPPKQLSRWRRAWNWLKERTWFLHSPVLLTVTLSPSRCYQRLDEIARPSVQRLHLSNLFARGRRYHLAPESDRGFQLTTTSKAGWHPRRRTSHSAILRGTFEHSEESDLTYLRLRSWIRPVYLLQSFFWPVFMASMIVYMPWPIVVQVLLIVSLTLAAGLGYRYNARLEAHDMLFFIEKALEDHIPESPALPAQSAEVVYGSQQDFIDAWERFYEQIQDEQQPDKSTDSDSSPSES